MSETATEPIRTFVLSHLAGPLTAVGVHPNDVSDELDLLAEGVLDSLGLIELIAAIEEHYDVVLDLEDLHPDDLGVVGPFCTYLERRVHPVNRG